MHLVLENAILNLPIDISSGDVLPVASEALDVDELLVSLAEEKEV
jgi:hypothetical protein